MNVSDRGLERSKVPVVTTFYEQPVEQVMSVDGHQVQDTTDSSSDDSPSRKRHLNTYDSNALHVTEDALDNESVEAKRQKTDMDGNRKPNADQWDTMFLRLAAYKAEKGVSLIESSEKCEPKKKPF